ncbi:6-phospho-beta-glucosidase [Streptomyces radicis]|uniref:6-phospho-beta-glucosidase n=1 Tax=Streptomyces radicis TaxID=1750517 RepID=A0A3A9WRQ9_9ACTN|nr:6-phospho-beta-glucosidase [Streptomyces radicis]RKN12224.1 6-phospho-beta-glucosidase [Streptomyces radicis]RKN26100.1 6-phospho-beta-glucosidase [Streptomyces radicis]
MRLTIIGGGGFRVPLVYRALLTTPGSEVTLFDPDGARVRVIGDVLAGMAAGRRDAPAVRIAPSLDEAVRGADFVFSAIRVGGTAGRVRDERVPLAEGVLGQETVGAGGVLYGLRTVPVALRIAARVRALAPDAWLINFTNPAGLVTEAMAAELGHRVIGICDSPVGLVRRAARAAGVDPEDVRYGYLGLNHLGWLRSLTHRGRDLLPGLLADDAALASFDEGRLFGGELLRALGALPNEYLQYYYRAPETLRAAREADETRGEFLDRRQGTFFAAAARDPGSAGALWERARREREETYGGGDRDPWDLEGGGYERVALALMHAIAEDRRTRLILNVRNGDACPALPHDAIVETVCEVDANGAHPVPCLSPGMAELGLMLQVKAAERATIEAAVRRSRPAALRALALHPLVGSADTASRILAAVAFPPL